jgi:hypothetical protein
MVGGAQWVWEAAQRMWCWGMLVARWMAERMRAAVSWQRPMMSRVMRQSWVEESRVERMRARASRGARTDVDGFWEK